MDVAAARRDQVTPNDSFPTDLVLFEHLVVDRGLHDGASLVGADIGGADLGIGPAERARLFENNVAAVRTWLADERRALLTP